jgi:hypothetical protein
MDEGNNGVMTMMKVKMKTFADEQHKDSLPQ